MFQLLKPGHAIPFMKLAMPATIFSGILILLSIFTIATKGFNLGIDFSGGRNYVVAFDKTVKTEEIKEKEEEQE